MQGDHAALSRVLAERLPDGRRRAVPVFGSGLNLQAALAAGAARNEEDDWAGLLDRVAEHLGIAADLPHRDLASMTARWEAFLWRVAGASNVQASVAEANLCRVVTQELRALESATAERRFYGRVLRAGFADIVSLNFDRRLALHGRSRAMSTAVPPPLPGVHERLEPSLYRHARVVRRRQETRIFFPHGDTARPDTLKLGVRAYGRYIDDLEAARARHKASEKRFVAHKSRTMGAAAARAAWPDAVRALAPGRLSWVDLFLTAPLVFVGCGLSTDEWPLWWTLHQRARNAARWAPERRQPTFALGFGDANPPAHLAGAPAGVQYVAFESPAALWDALLGAAESATAAPAS